MNFFLAEFWLTGPQWQAIGLSLLVALVSVLASLPFGVGLGWVLSRYRFWGKSLLETILNLPLVLPPVVTGYMLLVAFGSKGFLGSFFYSCFGIRFLFDWKGATLAAAVVSFPLMVRSIKLAFSSFDQRLESAAKTLGGRPLGVFFSVSLPLAKRGILAGSVLAFARGLGEFGATIMIAGNIQGKTQTIPLYIFDQLQTPGGTSSVYGVVVVSVLISAAALLASNFLEKDPHEKRTRTDSSKNVRSEAVGAGRTIDTELTDREVEE